jgi:hypothetical protein
LAVSALAHVQMNAYARFEENKPNCDDNHRNQTISNGWTVFEAPGVEKSLFFRNLVSPFP